MSNNWHTPTPALVSGDVARAEDVNDKITALDVAFDKLPEPHPSEKGFNEPIMVGAPTDPGHAASRNFVETGMTSQVVAAAASATAALASQSAAATSQSAAATSAAAALVSQNAASASQTAAAASQSAASASQTAAASSASAALASQTAAASSASSASTSAGAASTSATAAAASQTAAGTSATNAAASAAAALASQTSATASATSATNSATSATNSATSATNSASSATTSASNASTSAAAALVSENKAELWADEAEDVEVETGKYSARHWAAKAQLGASGFAIVAGNTGTATADAPGDTITISGSSGITTAAGDGPETLVITPTYGTTPSQITVVAASAGVANTIARTDHVHSISTAAAVTLNADTANGEGAATSLARSNHTHAISTAAPSANLTATTTNSAGVSASLTRADHSHAITTAAAVTLNADSANGLGSATSLARSDHTHSITTGTPSGSLGANTANAIGVATSLARSDHAHALATGTPVALGAALSAGSSNNLARADHVHSYPTLLQVSGYSDATTATANTIARRDASAHLYAQNFNQASSNNENPTISQFLVQNGSDNFLRKASIAHVLSQLGANTSKSLAASGYYYLPGGLLIQWGQTSFSGNGATNVFFPVAFSTCYVAMGSSTGNSYGTGSQDNFPATVFVAPTYFQMFAATDTGGTFYWFAIGAA